MTAESSAPASTSSWRVEHHDGRADDLHSLDVSGGRSVHLMAPAKPALVLGSTQALSSVDTVRAATVGIEVCRRRSGGGIVFVHPLDSIWIDVHIPRNDPQWVDDVSRSSLWLGHAWVEALAECGIKGASVYDGPMHRGDFGAVVCFASTAPGEVFIGDGKVVGVSQRRDRSGARFQCIVYRHWTPEVWSGLVTDASASTATAMLNVSDVVVPREVLLDRLRQALENR